jgi:ABC-type transport system involved in multi-copper enzyme maturation permease subunit
MGRAWVIATNTLLEIRRRRLVYLVVALVIVTGLVIYGMTSMLHLAERAGETALVSRLSPNIVTATFGFWDGFIELVTIFVGATVVSAEVKSRAIIPTLAHPIDRREFLLGKVLGIAMTAGAFFTIPLAIGLVTARQFGVGLPYTFWLGLVQMLVSYVTLGAMTVAVAAVTSPMVGGLAVLFVLPLTTFLGQALAKSSNPATAALGFVLYCLGPAKPPHAFIHEAFFAQAAGQDLGLVMLTMIENLGYAAVVFTLATWIFDRREFTGEA